MTEAQKCLHHIAENMRMDKSISKEGYEYFQQAIKALEEKPKTGHWIITSDYLTTAYGSVDIEIEEDDDIAYAIMTILDNL